MVDLNDSERQRATWPGKLRDLTVSGAMTESRQTLSDELVHLGIKSPALNRRS